MIMLKAHYDGQKICLDEPCDLPPGTKLLVLVAPDPEEAFRQDWLAFSQQAFARAYGDDEPDYADCIGKLPPA